MGPATPRVASLLPSATEIVCALGARDALVGVSHECDFPAGIAALPALTRARLKPVTRSRDIDTEVRAILQDALAVYEIELDRLATARPELIVTQDLCDVCAVSLDDVRAAVATAGPPRRHPHRQPSSHAPRRRLGGYRARRRRAGPAGHGGARRGWPSGARGEHRGAQRDPRRSARGSCRSSGSIP